MIRKATPADIPSIIEVERACATAAHWTEHQYQQMFLPKKGDPQRLVVVAGDSPEERSGSGAETNSRPVLGFLVARQIAPEWELENIVVAPAARRTGLGKRLLEALLIRARETNSDTVFLEVRESNAAARSLYEKTGFELTGLRKSYYTNPQEDAVVYRLTLG
jgi:[ribosomal protein S18]-alanine N-acetyltransferase